MQQEIGPGEELCDSRYRCLPCAVQHMSRPQASEPMPMQQVASAAPAAAAPTTMDTKEMQSVQQQKTAQPATEHAEKEMDQQPVTGQAIRMNLLPELQLTGLISKVMKLAGYSMDQLRATVASPPCETFSLADASNISRGHYYRNHQDHTKPPRSAASCKTAQQAFKKQMAIEHDSLVRYPMESYIADKEAGHDYDF